MMATFRLSLGAYWKQLQRSRNTAVLVLAIASLIQLCAITIADPDLWGHTLYGLRAVEQGVLLESADPFSFTAVAANWVNHEWLSEYYMGLLYGHWGNPGLWLWRTCWAVLLVGTFAVRWTADARLNIGAATFTLLFSAIALQGFFVYIRPQLATLGLFAVTLELLRRAWQDSRFLEQGCGLWLLVPILVFWTNLHGGFVAGLAIIWLFALGAVVRARIQEQTKRGAVRLLVVAVLASWATLINPYGYHLHSMLWQHLVPHQDVTEWEPLFSRIHLPLVLPVVLFCAATISIAVDLVRRRSSHSVPIMELVVSAACLLQALSHRRHVALLTIAVVILLAVPLSRFVAIFFRHLLSHCTRMPGLATTGFVAVVALVVGLRVTHAGQIHKHLGDVAVLSEGLTPGVPVRAIGFLRQLGVQGNLVTSYGWGQCVIWHLHPNVRVAFDGRYRTIYPPQVERDFLDFCRATGTEGGLPKLLRDYPTNIALLPKRWPVVSVLENDANWHRVYEDQQAVVFLHQNRLSLQVRRGIKKLSTQSLQVAQWGTFPSASCQDFLTIRCTGRNHVSFLERPGRNTTIVRSTRVLAQEVQLNGEARFIAR